MTATLADFWYALCPVLPSAWETSINRENLVQMAQRMAPIPRIGLECRLDNSTPQVDLQQCIYRDDGEAALLRDFILATQPAALEDDDAWARLHRFCTAWADPTTLLHQSINAIFLEYDLDTTPRPALTPSHFLDLGDANTTSTAREACVQAALALLLPLPWPSGLATNLARCFSACPPNAYISHLGVMLGRTTQALRVNVKRLRLDDLSSFLRAVGWSGSLDVAEQWAAWAYDRVDRITVCIDVGTVVYPQLGLECVLTLQPPNEPHWQVLLEELCAAGLCTSENAAAFLSLPGVLRPPETQVGWPAAWIAAMLLSPTDQFSTTERRLSHLKLTLMGQHVLVKGYWGAGHVWRKASLQGKEGVEVQQRLPHFAQERPPEARELLDFSEHSVEQALTEAIAFLLSQQEHTGRWHDFCLPAGPSDEWVTAFVAACLLETSAPIAHSAAQRAWQALLCRRRDDPGWGYSRLTPADADSIAWALRLAAGLGVDQDERCSTARHFLTEHLLANGGITTYAARDPIRRYTRLPEEASLAGWQAAHACVTAAAAPFVGTLALDYLVSQQSTAGHWQSYWWWDDEYATALAAEALATNTTQALARAVAWALTQVSATGARQRVDKESSPWATAWRVRILRLGRTADAQAASTRAIGWLLRTQQDDGSWRASARLRVPMPGQVDAVAQEIRLNGLDQNRIFTTAAVAAALGMSISAKQSDDRRMR